MTDSMVERVARAICAATNIAMEGVTEVVLDNPDFVIPAHKRTDGKALPRWQLYVPKARAAIAAMREPTEAMIDATGSDWGSQLEDNWQAMIDEALK